jgi:hypothetical protein
MFILISLFLLNIMEINSNLTEVSFAMKSNSVAEEIPTVLLMSSFKETATL